MPRKPTRASGVRKVMYSSRDVVLFHKNLSKSGFDEGTTGFDEGRSGFDEGTSPDEKVQSGIKNRSSEALVEPKQISRI